jgi:hypothetical protein
MAKICFLEKYLPVQKHSHVSLVFCSRAVTIFITVTLLWTVMIHHCVPSPFVVSSEWLAKIFEVLLPYQAVSAEKNFHDRSCSSNQVQINYSILCWVRWINKNVDLSMIRQKFEVEQSIDWTKRATQIRTLLFHMCSCIQRKSLVC